jgi:hypothetical protein
MEPDRAPASLSALNALLPGAPTVFRSAKGAVYLWEGAPHVFVTSVVGTLTAEGAQAIDTAARRTVDRIGSHHAFHEWQSMTDYESEARARLTQAGVELLKHSLSIQVLAKSSIVRLGVQAVSLVLRKIRMHDDYRSFENELRRAMRGEKVTH